MNLDKHATLAALPPEWPHDVLPEIQQRLRESGQTVVVLDDDPTGTQTVHGIPVLTEWSVEALRAEFERGTPAFYVLTNTRAMTADKARAANEEIVEHLTDALPPAPSPSPVGRGVVILSRSDSTLRGHFPVEIDALRTKHTRHAPTLLVPAFFAGGRYTLNDVHYVASGDALVPTGETEFAKDAAFGYRASNLRDWVEEKTEGQIKSNEVASISIDDIRIGGPNLVLHKMLALQPASVCVVNAASERDLEVVALASILCEAQSHPLLYRTAASFARARVGIAAQPLLAASDLTNIVDTCQGASAPKGGLIIVGSYVPKTSGQLEELLQIDIDAIEVDVHALLDDATQQAEIARVAHAADALIRAGKDTVIYTSRTLITGNDAAHSLAIGNRVSASLIAILRSVSAQPRFVIAKGGITSSDVATKGLNVKRALVLGQLLPGVPVWQLGPESRYPDSIYVIFPGNVGEAGALVEARSKLSN